jgi:hypothetical protein
MHEYFPSFEPSFPLVEMVLGEWENCNILDKTRNVLIHPPMLIEKSVLATYRI